MTEPPASLAIAGSVTQAELESTAAAGSGVGTTIAAGAGAASGVELGASAPSGCGGGATVGAVVGRRLCLPSNVAIANMVTVCPISATTVVSVLMWWATASGASRCRLACSAQFTVTVTVRVIAGATSLFHGCA